MSSSWTPLPRGMVASLRSPGTPSWNSPKPMASKSMLVVPAVGLNVMCLSVESRLCGCGRVCTHVPLSLARVRAPVAVVLCGGGTWVGGSTCLLARYTAGVYASLLLELTRRCARRTLDCRPYWLLNDDEYKLDMPGLYKVPQDGLEAWRRRLYPQGTPDAGAAAAATDDHLLSDPVSPTTPPPATTVP
eukprot:m.56142 g.56142  ORF g.56142 m.56142 type:complete len:189 (+) comp7654_c0_seq1:1678-2244(+)